MHYIETVSDLQALIQYEKSQDHPIAFVPTMGALHDGHISLVKAAKDVCPITVVSLFVNPTQFDDSSDLDNYPRTIGADLRLLYASKTNIVFVPPVAEIYPPEGIHTPTFDFGSLTTVMEGTFRKGHFDGVAQVVHRLLDVVQPDRLFMGQKDYQQWTIIDSMLRQINSQTQLEMVPTLRESDGLAMSSRNQRLTPAFRAIAPKIYEILQSIPSQIHQQSITEIQDQAIQEMTSAGLRPEYVSIIDGFTLQPITDPTQSSKIVACTAAWAGEIRLIDNIIVKDSQRTK